MRYSEPIGSHARDIASPPSAGQGDRLIKHQPFGVETLTLDNVFGAPTRTLDFTRASQGRLQAPKELSQPYPL